MPILPLEPFVYPGDLFEASAPRFDTRRWWVLHTKPRTEKSLARNLLVNEQTFFLPLERKFTRTGARTRVSHLPLFPGYLFLYGDDEARLGALTTNLVVRCLQVPNENELFSDLCDVHRVMTSNLPVIGEERLPPGTPVEIVAGPLAGMKGKVIHQGKKLHFIVEVHFLQRGARVEIDGDMLERLPE